MRNSKTFESYKNDGLHLSALRDDDIQVRDILASISGLGVLHFPHHIHTINHASKHHVLAIQEWRGYGGDEKLTSIGIGPAVSHAEQARSIMLQVEVLVGELVGAIDGGRAGAVAIDEVATLTHEVLDDPMESAALVALRTTEIVLTLAGAELPEVFGSFGHNVCEELHCDAAQRFS